MSVLERICNWDGCIQCWAEEIVAASDQAVEHALEVGIRDEPVMKMVGVPQGDEMASIKRLGRRESKLIARLALLEPHECGRAVGSWR